MISVTDLRSGVVYEESGQYLLVISYEHNKMGRGSGNVKVKVRNLETGAVVEKSYITGARVQDASLDRKKVQYLYREGNNFVVMDTESYEQFSLSPSQMGSLGKFLKEGLELTLYCIGDKPMYVEAPKVLEYTVVQTAGAARGNSVGATQKDAVLDNGLIVKVPLFIKNGEVIRVDTRDGSYVERAK